MKAKPELISDDFIPSDDLINWCNQKGITSLILKDELPSFIFWHKEKKVRRSNFNLAFRNWLKRSINVTVKNIDKSKIGNQSYQHFKPTPPVNKNKSLGRESLNKIKGLI